MAFNDLDDSNDRQLYRNYAPRIAQRPEEATIEAKLVIMGNTGKYSGCLAAPARPRFCLPILPSRRRQD